MFRNKDGITPFGIIFVLTICLYCTIFCMQTLVSFFNDSTCSLVPARIEYIFPGYRFGCWLMERPSNNKSHEAACDYVGER